MSAGEWLAVWSVAVAGAWCVDRGLSWVQRRAWR
jgi:hypothetical protein